MPSISIPPFYSTSTAQQRPTQSPTSETPGSSRAATQNQRQSTTALTGDPTDIITTSPAASALLGALNSQLSLGSAESQKDFDAKQLKAAIQQLHILQLLGIGLGPEELAKQTTALAKQIAGIAKDYADNSGSTPAAAVSTSSAPASATSEADTAATQATRAASTANGTVGSAAAGADQASQTAKTGADKAKRSAESDAETAQSATGTADASASSSTASGTNQSTATKDPDQAAADDPNDFFGEIAGAFKDLKKLESRALSQLNLSPDKAKKKEAKKLGGEFNDAAQSAAQSAGAAGATGAQRELAGQTIDLSKVTLNISV